MDEQKVKDWTRSSSDDYYADVLKKIYAGEKIIWNNAAFWGTFHWMIYRKMFAPAFLCFAFLTYLFVYTNSLAFLAGYILSMILSGFFGNALYYIYVKSRLERGFGSCGTHYIPVCHVALFTQVGIVYPALLSLLALLGKFRGWASQNAELFDNSTQKLFEAYATLNPNDYQTLLGAVFGIGLVLVLQFIILPAFFCGRDLFILWKSKKKLKKELEKNFNDENIRILSSTKADEYYWKQFRKIEKGAIFSLNFSACFFGGRLGFFWFLYRKAYRAAAVSGGILILYFLMLVFGNFSSQIGSALSILLLAADFILLLGGANHIYYREIKDKISAE